jgi:hypothetical protein
VPDTDLGPEGPSPPRTHITEDERADLAANGRDRWPAVLVVLALVCWLAPVPTGVFLGNVLIEDPSAGDGDQILFLIVLAVWLLFFVPVGSVLMVAAWLSRRRTLSVAAVLAAIGVVTVGIWSTLVSMTTPNLDDLLWADVLASMPSAAAVVVAVVDLLARRSGAERSRNLLALGVGMVTLLWSVLVLGARWPSG